MSQTAKRIQAELAREIELNRRLLVVVQQERDILLAGRHQRLMETSQRKVELCGKLAEVQERRRRLAAELSPDGEPPARLGELLALVPEEYRPALREQVAELTALAREVERTNQGNREFVQEALDTVEHLMAVLASGGRTQAYGRSAPQATLPRLVTREV
jgi:flagellar biosynthesis/type III secretory pathway chaperone